MSHTVFEDWIVGVFGILVMAFFIGCSSCWQFFRHKSADPAGRRHPPPPPSPDLETRYESDRYHQNPPPDPEAQHSSSQKPMENDEDSEEDFEELQDLRTAQQSDVNGQNSATSWKCAEKAATCQDTYVNTDEVQDYVNLPKPDPEFPIYVKIIDSDPEMEVTTRDKEKEENKTPRSAINSIGKYSSQSDSLCHSYENVAVEGPQFGSESDMDYVNTSRSSALEPFCH